MSIKNNTVGEVFDSVEVIGFSYVKDFRQAPKPKLHYRWQKIKIDENGIKSRSDEPPQEVFIKDVNELIVDRLTKGSTEALDAFVALQKFIAKEIQYTTGLDVIYEAD